MGYLQAEGGYFKRSRKNVYIVIGILAEYRGLGIGTQLFIKAENWAREQGMHRLELTVVAQNIAAIALYERRGFSIEGIRKDALLIDGQYRDELYMAKLLQNETQT